jgi:oligopeptidase B
MTDPYSWLRERANPSVLKHLENENAHTATVMQPTEPLQATLYREMLARIKQTDLSVPVRRGQYLYYARTEEGRQYPWMCRREGSMDAPEDVLLDLNALAEGHEFLGLGAYEVSDDGQWLAFSLDTTGYRDYTLYVKELATGRTLDETIERAGSVAWAADNRTLFYTSEEPVSKRSYRLWRRVIGSGASDLLYEEADDRFDLTAGRSDDKSLVFLASAAKTSSEFRYLRADDPAGAFTLILLREPGHEYDVEHYRGQFYIRTNRDAQNFRVVTVPVEHPADGPWTTFIAHNPAVKIEGLTCFAHHLVIWEKEGGLDHLRVIDMTSGESHRIETDEEDRTIAPGANPEFDTTSFRFTFESMVSPPSVYEYDMTTRDRRLLKQQPVLGGYEPPHYEGRRIWITARDGVRVPISVVYRKGTPLDGTAPLLLYGYGAYGISLAPTFSSNRLSLLDRGAIYATAYVRGGGELGEAWRDQGRMMHKMNSFTDFIDCAEGLVRETYTSPDRLVSHGGSAGGLLVSAAANMRPDLFKAVVAQVPFVDVVNTMLDASLPLTTGEYLEWGNPQDPEVRQYLLRYSPYDNIRPQAYPAMLVQVSLHDSQVPYWEGAKFIARLRDLRTDQNPTLLKAEMGAGHGGPSGRYDALRETAFTYAFILWQMGIAEKSVTE